MPKTCTIDLYTIDELNPDAKEKARQWYRELWDSNDSSEITMAIREHVSIHHGLESEGYEPGTVDAEDEKKQSLKIYWGLSSCQGDGVAFEGTFDLLKLAKKQKDAGKILRRLWRLGAQVSARVKHSGRYTHWNSMEVSVDADSCRREDEPDARWQKREAKIEDLQGGLQDLLQELFKDISRDAEKAGYAEIEYKQGAEYIDETLMANEYTFLENGERFSA